MVCAVIVFTLGFTVVEFVVCLANQTEKWKAGVPGAHIHVLRKLVPFKDTIFGMYGCHEPKAVEQTKCVMRMDRYYSQFGKASDCYKRVQEYGFI